MQRSFQNSSSIDTGLSDFHKMTVTVLGSYFQKAEPKVVMYRDYNTNTKNEIYRILTILLSEFLYKCLQRTLAKVAPLK